MGEDVSGEAEFEAWAEETLAKVRGERNAEHLKILTEAVGPLERHRYKLRDSIEASYALVHGMERELIVVEDRLKFCNRAIRTGEVPRGVDTRRFTPYLQENEPAANADLSEKEENDERHDDGPGVRGQRAPVGARPRARSRGGK